jgi:mediator of RNA polymerase II transcription subunit 17, fungi type
MVSYEKTEDGLVYPSRLHSRLSVSMTETDSHGVVHQSKNNIPVAPSTSLDDSLTNAQREIVDREIYGLLVKEASDLPSVSTRVSERLVVIDAAEGAVLKFELVRSHFASSATLTLVLFVR